MWLVVVRNIVGNVVGNMGRIKSSDVTGTVGFSTSFDSVFLKCSMIDSSGSRNHVITGLPTFQLIGGQSQLALL